MSTRLEPDLSLEKRSCCCVHRWPDPLPLGTDPEQISTGDKTTYSPDTFCSLAITWQDTECHWFRSGLGDLTRGTSVVFASVRREYCGIWKQTVSSYARLPDGILDVDYFRPLWDFTFWGRRVCYWDVASCRRFGKPVDSIFRVKIISRPGEIGRMRKMEKIVRVWLAPIDRGPEEGGESTAARSCSFPLAIFFIGNDFPPAAVY